MQKVRHDVPSLDGGMITDQDPRKLRDNVCVLLQNMIPRDGYSERRPGLRPYIESLPDNFVRVDRWRKTADISALWLMQTGTNLWECRDKGFDYIGGVELSDVAPFVDNDENALVYFMNRVQPKKYDGTTLSNWTARSTWPAIPRYSGVPNGWITTAVPSGNLLAEHFGRFFVAGITGKPDVLFYSEVGYPDLFDHVQVEGDASAGASNWVAIGDDGEAITALIAAWNKLYVFKANNRLYSVDSLDASPENWAIKRVLGIGCPNPRSLTLFNNRVMLLDGASNVREFTGVNEYNHSKDKIGKLLQEYATGGEYGGNVEIWTVDTNEDWMATGNDLNNVTASGGNLVVAYDSDSWGDETQAETGERLLTSNPGCGGSVLHTFVEQGLTFHKDTRITNVHATFDFPTTATYGMRCSIKAGPVSLASKDHVHSGSSGEQVIDFDFGDGVDLHSKTFYTITFTVYDYNICYNCAGINYYNGDIITTADEVTSEGVYRRNVDGNIYHDAGHTLCIRIEAEYRTGIWTSEVHPFSFPKRRQFSVVWGGIKAPKIYARWGETESEVTGGGVNWVEIRDASIIPGRDNDTDNYMVQIKIVISDNTVISYFTLQDMLDIQIGTLAVATSFDDLYLLSLKKKDGDERSIFGIDRKGRWMWWDIPARDFIKEENKLYILTSDSIYEFDPDWLYDGDVESPFTVAMETKYLDFKLPVNDKNLRMLHLRQEGKGQVTGYVRSGGKLVNKMVHLTLDGSYIKRPIPELIPIDWEKDYGNYCYTDLAIDTNKARLYFVAGDTVDEFDFDGVFKYRYVIPNSGAPWFMTGIDVDSADGWVYCLAYNSGAATGRIYRHKLTEGGVTDASYMSLDFDPEKGITKNGNYLYFGDQTNHRICRCRYNETITKINCPLDLSPYPFNPRHITFDGTACYMTNSLRYVLKMEGWSGDVGAWASWYIYGLESYFIENLGGINNDGSTLYIYGQRTGGATDYLIRAPFGGANAYVLDITSEDWKNVYQGMLLSSFISIPDEFVTTVHGQDEYDIIKIPFPQTMLGKGFSLRFEGNSNELNKIFGFKLLALAHKLR